MEQVSWRPVAGWRLMLFVSCFTQLIIAAFTPRKRLRSVWSAVRFRFLRQASVSHSVFETLGPGLRRP
jgi:hypothetical protein